MSGGEWTVFAPTNMAFLSLPPAYVEEVTDDEAKLKELLLFHTVAGRVIMGADMPCLAGENLITMSTGMDTRTLCVDGVPTFQKGVGNQDNDLPRFVTLDFDACNGVVHKLDGVMLFQDVEQPINDGRVAHSIQKDLGGRVRDFVTLPPSPPPASVSVPSLSPLAAAP